MERSGIIAAKAYRSIRTAFHTACEHAGLKEVTPHGLRAHRRLPAGAGRRGPADDSGARRGASLDMVQRYTHLSPTHKVEAVERIA